MKKVFLYLTFLLSMNAILIAQNSSSTVKSNTKQQSKNPEDGSPIVGLLILTGVGVGYYFIKKKHKEKIINKYGAEIGNKILKKTINQGMTTEMLFDSWGKPGKTDSSVMKGKAVYQYYFHGQRNKRGNMKYATRVTVENGVIVGWKDGNF